MSRIAGLNDIKKKQDSEEKKNEYFAGGVDNRGGGSGLAVEGPPNNDKKKSNIRSTEAFDGIVKQAQERGVANHEGPSSGNITITLYSNGFTVNDGPLRDITSNENKIFLASLERGELPAELKNSANPGIVDVNLIDKRSEEFKAPPPPSYVAYSGPVSKLGSKADDGFIFSNDILSDIDPIDVDSSKPTTTVLVKAADGKKLKILINQDSTVLQLAATISRLTGSSENFILTSGYPPSSIADPTLTLKEANVVGASITQKLL